MLSQQILSNLHSPGYYIIFLNHSPGTVPPSTLLDSPSDDGHDYETQGDWDDDDDETPPREFYSGYPSVGSSDDEEEEEEEAQYEQVNIKL